MDWWESFFDEGYVEAWEASARSSGRLSRLSPESRLAIRAVR